MYNELRALVSSLVNSVPSHKKYQDIQKKLKRKFPKQLKDKDNEQTLTKQLTELHKRLKRVK